MDFLEQMQQKIAETKNGFEYFLLSIGVFFLTASIFNWDWMFEPPYTHKNFIGRTFGRTAYRYFNGFFSIIMIVIALFLLIRQK
jgi:hypothetical protein